MGLSKEIYKPPLHHVLINGSCPLKKNTPGLMPPTLGKIISSNGAFCDSAQIQKNQSI
jgi:hypothetical protein